MTVETEGGLEPAERVGVRPLEASQPASLDNGRHHRLNRCGNLPLLRKSVLAVKVLVDGEKHALCAVGALGLRAVEPERAVVDDGELVDVWVLALGGGKVEAGEEAGAVREGRAGVGEVGLRDGVVGGEEVNLGIMR